LHFGLFFIFIFPFYYFLYFDLFFLKKIQHQLDKKKLINDFKMDVLIAKCIENKFSNFVFFQKGVENDKNKANASKLYFFVVFLIFLFSNFF
jgi:hypothetical protein